MTLSIEKPDRVATRGQSLAALPRVRKSPRRFGATVVSNVGILF